MADKELTEDELLKKTEERMAVAMTGKSPADEDELDDDLTPEDKDIEDNIDDDDDQDDDDDGDDDSTPADDDDDDDDKDEDDSAKDDGANDKDEKVELSDAYYRAATNSGMSHDEIVEFMAASPELAVKTFAKMHDNMNSVSNEFAVIGRAKKKAAEDAANGDADNDTSQKSTFKKIDTAKIREENPDSDALVNLIDGLQDQNQTMHDQMEQLKQAPVIVNNEAQDKLELDRQVLISQQIDTFFNDPSMVAFNSTYGAISKDARDWSELMPSEKVNRYAVIEQVEQLMEGAKAVGREMEVPEALERAHMIVTQPIQKRMIREDIMKDVVKRSKGISLKPSSAKSAVKKTKKAKTEKDVVANAAARMAKIKW